MASPEKGNNLVEIDLVEIDKNKLYGRNYAGQDRQAEHTAKLNDLHLSTAYMALDLPEPGEPVGDINVSKGLSAKGVVGVVMAATVPVVALAAAMFWNSSKPTPAVAPLPKVEAKTRIETKTNREELRIDPLEVIPPK